MLARALLEPPPEPAPPSTNGGFAMRRAVFADARRRSGLDEAEFEEALRARGSPEQRCRADIAVIEAALALTGDERTRFLRDMSRSL